MRFLTNLLDWITLAAATVAVLCAIVSLIRGRRLASSLLLVAALFLWMSRFDATVYDFMGPRATGWFTWGGIAVSVIFTALRPWRYIPKTYERLFNVSIAGFLLIFGALLFESLIIKQTSSVFEKTSVWISVMFVAEKTLAAAKMVLLASVAYIWAIAAGKHAEDLDLPFPEEPAGKEVEKEEQPQEKQEQEK